MMMITEENTIKTPVKSLKRKNVDENPIEENKNNRELPTEIRW